MPAMNLTGTIESAELQFRQVLEEFFISVYDEKSLPSHGIDHHRRVWNNAKEILSVSHNKNKILSSDFISNLIIASYLHDIGMSVDSGFRHGIHSRDLTARFLSANNFDINEFTGLLEAIENHDKKDYPGETKINDLLSILSVADDLDAFGFMGIYRYAEIYLMRDIKPEIIGEMIIENAEKRYNHFKVNFAQYTELFQKHQYRYEILKVFFNEYNKQALSYNFNITNPTGYCGAIELIMKMIEKKSDLQYLLSQQEKYQNEKEISWFLNGLKTEI
jgi:HD superfamily phosphodiesterase